MILKEKLIPASYQHHGPLHLHVNGNKSGEGKLCQQLQKTRFRQAVSITCICPLVQSCCTGVWVTCSLAVSSQQKSDYQHDGSCALLPWQAWELISPHALSGISNAQLLPHFPFPVYPCLSPIRKKSRAYEGPQGLWWESCLTAAALGPQGPCWERSILSTSLKQTRHEGGEEYVLASPLPLPRGVQERNALVGLSCH